MDSDGHDREQELDEQYPNRPHNQSKALPFHDLHLTLFNPLNDIKKKPTGPTVARRKLGPSHGKATQNPHEIRQNIIERFISRWRKEVGDDIYPAFRLVIPDKDRERPMYGLKESIIGKLLIQVMKINKDSEDGQNLRNWKAPGHTSASRMAGDFAGRCYEVISKRPMRTKPGDMNIDEVNTLLDQLAVANKQSAQENIFSQFYSRMNAEELMWLIRIVLRQMKVGASEKTFFNIFHPDAEQLFNICSNLRRVCWELYDPRIRLHDDDAGVKLMSCFQPQLAQFQMDSFKKMVDRMRPTEEDPVFWIEEKLDGERMQLHMIEDSETPGGKRFGFWSRKAKDYTHLYGSGFEDERSSLTRFLAHAFDEGVNNIILDGEMITWDPNEDLMVPFGTLKTAAKLQQDNPYSSGWRPLYRIFDILYLNGQDLTNYTLRDRRAALQQAIKPVERRFELHTYEEARDISEIEPNLRRVVAESSEGLVLKNPRSAYRLNQRNDDWIKVKPDYMNEFGENLDCLIIGGYYGSGRRGGALSSFLCGLRVDHDQASQSATPTRFYSFCKVGGGFAGSDLATIRHKTDGKWKKFDPKKPPNDYIALASQGRRLIEQPDEWILPSDSLVVEVKAASVAATDTFKMGLTLRFPRFKRIREDKNWQTALSVSDFVKLKNEAEGEKKEKEFQYEQSRRKKPRISKKKPLKLAGNDVDVDEAKFAPRVGASIFAGHKFFIMTPLRKPNAMSKDELQKLVKSNGGEIVQNYSQANTICIADNRSVHAASAIKRGDTDVVRPLWLFDNLKQTEIDGDRATLLLPFEPRHMLFTRPEHEDFVAQSVDRYGDAYARDLSVSDLQALLDSMPSKYEHAVDVGQIRSTIFEGVDSRDTNGDLFIGTALYLDLERDDSPSAGDPSDALRLRQAGYTARFAGAQTEGKLEQGVTHVVVNSKDKDRLTALRRKVADFNGGLPRFVTAEWIEQSWREGTLLDEERFSP